MSFDSEPALDRSYFHDTHSCHYHLSFREKLVELVEQLYGIAVRHSERSIYDVVRMRNCGVSGLYYCAATCTACTFGCFSTSSVPLLHIWFATQYTHNLKEALNNGTVWKETLLTFAPAHLALCDSLRLVFTLVTSKWMRSQVFYVLSSDPFYCRTICVPSSDFLFLMPVCPTRCHDVLHVTRYLVPRAASNNQL